MILIMPLPQILQTITAKIAANAITAGKLATDAITSRNYTVNEDGSIHIKGTATARSSTFITYKFTQNINEFKCRAPLALKE